MSRKRKQYKNRIIEVTTYPLADNKGFTAHFEIEDHTAGKHIDITHFESAKAFATDSEALEWGFAAGQLKVDTGYEKEPLVNNK